MRIHTRRRWSGPAAGALAVLLGAPGLANAQQSGLFPNASIRRERVPCQNEDPVYRLYRHEYFGYHPTCWRRFPTGWGCPSPEAPNAAAEFQKLPRDKPPELDPDNGQEPGLGPDDGGAMPRPGGVPPLPGDAGARDGIRPAPNALPPLPSGDRNPFDLPGDNAPATPPPASRGTDAPVVPAPAGTDTPPPATPPGSEGQAEVIVPRNDQPLLALPDPTVNPSGGRSNPRGVGGGESVAGFPLPNGEAPLAPPLPSIIPPPSHNHTPAQAPRRTGMLGNFFNGIFRR